MYPDSSPAPGRGGDIPPPVKMRDSGETRPGGLMRTITYCVI
nr:MAG TPA: hypothetical protein [Caudoviricetes sp.]